MSPERHDFLVHSAERGRLWREAIRAYRAGERGASRRRAIAERICRSRSRQVCKQTMAREVDRK